MPQNSMQQIEGNPELFPQPGEYDQQTLRRTLGVLIPPESRCCTIGNPWLRRATPLAADPDQVIQEPASPKVLSRTQQQSRASRTRRNGSQTAQSGKHTLHYTVPY